MKKYLLIPTAMVLAVWLTAGCTSGAKKEIAAAEAKKIADMEQRLKQLEAEQSRLQDRELRLQKELERFAQQEKLYLEKLDKQNMLRIPNKLVFGSGSTAITAEGKRILAGFADILNRYPEYELRVEGHTDNKQIKPEFQTRYPSNWELSSARATAVIRLLVSEYKMTPKKLGAVGYGEFRPITVNTTEEGRAQNRRVEFYIVPEMPSKPLAM